jgi:hypothetical protein
MYVRTPGNGYHLVSPKWGRAAFGLPSLRSQQRWCQAIALSSRARDLLSSAEHQSLLAGIPALDEDGENSHYVCDEVTLRTNDLALRSQAAISEEAALHVAL